MEDGGRPSGIGYQELVSNQSKLLHLRGVVVKDLCGVWDELSTRDGHFADFRKRQRA